MTVAWKEELTLGIPVLDAQHQEVDRQLGLVLEDLREGRTTRLLAALDGVRDCMSRHFVSEEAVMARSADPALVAHHARHREFLEQLAAFEDRCDREGPTRELAVGIASWLDAWIREHQRFDLHVAAQARRAGLPEAAPAPGPPDRG